MDRPPPDPTKLLAIWQRWEAGDALPGKTMAELKTGGLPDLLESMLTSADVGADTAAE
jgi:hypothetical protein